MRVCEPSGPGRAHPEDFDPDEANGAGSGSFSRKWAADVVAHLSLAGLTIARRGTRDDDEAGRTRRETSE